MRAQADFSRMARRPGFTLLEVLVVVAVATVLVAVLLPLISSARTVALRVVCTSRIRDLTLACNLHRLDRKAYPLQPGTTRGSPTSFSPFGPISVVGLPPPKPTDIDAAFLNALRPYLRFPQIDARLAGPSDLPLAVQCPTAEDTADVARQTFVSLRLTPAFYTGYAYCVRPKDATLAAAVRLLRPERVADPGVAERAVVWADDVHWSVPNIAWSFAHTVPRAEPGPTPLSFASRSALLGQHRAYTDGSVEWVNGSEINLELNLRNPAQSAASLSVFNLYFFWF